MFLVDAVRTPFGKNKGALSGVRTDDLAATPVKALMDRNAWLSIEDIDDVYLGNTNGAGEDNRNIARMAGLLAGLPHSVPGVTVNRLCGSGAEAIVQASRAVALGDADVVIAGGVEGMTRAPFVMERSATAFPKELKLHQTTVGWRMVNPLFPDHWTAPLGVCAERVAAGLGIGRTDMDEFAARSHQLVARAYDRGYHDGFVSETAGLAVDESLRPETTVKALAALRPAFDAAGAVTAGNASPVNDGAAATILASASALERHALVPMGCIVGAVSVGVAPDQFAIAPVEAINKLLRRHDLGFQDVARWEINEAFAAVVLACSALLPEMPVDRLNVNGGAIAIGHPLGASAVRMIVDLCRELKRAGGGYGVAAACIGVGQGQALLVKV